MGGGLRLSRGRFLEAMLLRVASQKKIERQVSTNLYPSLPASQTSRLGPTFNLLREYKCQHKMRFIKRRP
jgi:hypothetical protein